MKTIESGAVRFQAEGRLLQELGLRLVARPEVALVELIKNAYDADSTECVVQVDKNDRALIVEDKGHGMTVDDFKNKWMRIATSSKLDRESTTKFGRPLTGAKGIGRFAVRFLGDTLALQSVAYDELRGFKTLLSANFKWEELDRQGDLSASKIPYTLEQADEQTPTGTKLIITDLRESASFARSSSLRDEVMRIVSPLQGLDKGDMGRRPKSQKNVDPGFQILLPNDDGHSSGLADEILKNQWGRLVIELRKQDLTYQVWLPGMQSPKELKISLPNEISRGVHADIRYFPRRKGIFQNKGFNGSKAWKWVRDNCGVKVVDHGFHIRPYGFPNDDWLHLASSKAHSQRGWMTSIATSYFPLTPLEKSSPSENPVLYLPYNFQLVGAVFIESARRVGPDSKDLIPSMDREGLLENKGFETLWEVVRGGIEFLAHEDKAELDRRDLIEARRIAQEAKKEVLEAIAFIEASPTLSKGDKARIVKQYQSLSDKVDEQEEHVERTTRSLLTMSLLGVVSGFMTHESKAILSELEESLDIIKALSFKHPELKPKINALEERNASFRGHLEYVQMFVRTIRKPVTQAISSEGQIRLIIKRFGSFAKERGIDIDVDIQKNLVTPSVPVNAYSGIILNLFTNALKAVTAAQQSIKKPRILFLGKNEGGKHLVQVCDNGVGIPPNLRKRIWDPLFTTTSDVGNPLGTGMGLGLTMIRQAAQELGGTVSLLSQPPAGFTTCFQFSLPLK